MDKDPGLSKSFSFVFVGDILEGIIILGNFSHNDFCISKMYSFDIFSYVNNMSVPPHSI